MVKENQRWRSPALGTRRELRLRGGTLGYHDAGSGPPLVFVHGALVNSNHWRKVVPRLATDFRCVTLDLPLGAHLEPMPADADLSPPGLAELIADALAALDLEHVTLVGNDTGGALCQIVVTRRPDRVAKLVLASCDAFENFPPKVMKPLMPILRQPGAIAALFAPLRIAAVRRRFVTLIRATKRPVEDPVLDSYAFPALTSEAIRRDTRKLLAAADERYTLEAGALLRRFERPALVAWAWEDKFFPTRYAERLASTLPDARLEWIDDSYTFSPEDQPERLAELIGSFAREPASGERRQRTGVADAEAVPS